MNKLTATIPDPANVESTPGPTHRKLDKQTAPWKDTAKSWIKKLPFFHALDFYRRKAYDSPVFDFTVKSLAEKLEEWPGALLMDATNRCNAKCSWCPNPDLTDLGTMDMGLFQKIAADYFSRPGRISFGTFGEPLMDKLLPRRIEYLQRFSNLQKIEVLTNGYFLNSKIIPVLIENRVAVDISLDELEKDTFENVKKMSFDVTRDGVLALLEANSQTSNPAPINIRIKTLRTMEETLNNPFFQRISDYDCSINLTPITDNIISNWAGKFDNQTFFKTHDIQTNEGSQFNHKEFNRTNNSPCTQLWKWMVIYWDGSVVLCCADMFNQSSLGNLQRQSISEIWNGTEFASARKKMVERKRFDIPLCTDCDIHLSWHNLKYYYDRDGAFRKDRRFIIG